jgi:hypothetical protein
MIIQYGVVDAAATDVDIPFYNAMPNEAFIPENLVSFLIRFH